MKPRANEELVQGVDEPVPEEDSDGPGITVKTASRISWIVIGGIAAVVVIGPTILPCGGFGAPHSAKSHHAQRQAEIEQMIQAQNESHTEGHE